MYVMELDQVDNGQAIQDELLALTGGRSVPRVFICGTFIGGGDDTEVSATRAPAREGGVFAGARSALSMLLS